MRPPLRRLPAGCDPPSRGGDRPRYGGKPCSWRRLLCGGKGGITLVFHLTQSKGVRVVEEENRLTFEIQTGGRGPFGLLSVQPGSERPPWRFDPYPMRRWHPPRLDFHSLCQRGGGQKGGGLHPRRSGDSAFAPAAAGVCARSPGGGGRPGHGGPFRSNTFAGPGPTFAGQLGWGGTSAAAPGGGRHLDPFGRGGERQLSIEGIQPESILWGEFSPDGQGLLLLVRPGRAGNPVLL